MQAALKVNFDYYVKSIFKINKWMAYPRNIRSTLHGCILSLKTFIFEMINVLFMQHNLKILHFAVMSFSALLPKYTAGSRQENGETLRCPTTFTSDTI